MKKLIALVLALIMVLSMVACGAKTEEPAAPAAPDASAADSPTETPKEEAPETPDEPRTLTIGWEKSPATLNAHANTENVVLQVGHLVHGFLTSLNNENGGPIQPAVAESWEYKSNTELVLHIRDDVYWHNGRQLTVEDIIYTFDWVKDEANGSSRRAQFLVIDKAEKTGDWEVTLTLANPDPSLLELMSYLCLVAEDTVDTLADAPIGCGPFKFVSWDEGQQINFEVFDKFYNAGTIQFDKLVMRTFGDYNAAMTAFFAGEVDVLCGVKGTDVAAVESRPGFYVQSIADTGNYVSCNTAQEKLANPKVREAIKYAIDKQEMIDILVAGVGEPVSQVLPTSNAFYNKELDWEVDRERAKQALIDAGYPDGLDIEILVPNTQARVDLATVLKEQLDQVGFNTTVNIQENATMFEIWNAGNAELAIGGFGFYADPSFRTTFLSSTINGAWKRYGFDDAEYNELLDQGKKSTDTAERKEIYSRVFQKAIDEAGFFMLFASTSNAAVKDNIEGLIFRGSGNSDFTQITFKK